MKAALLLVLVVAATAFEIKSITRSEIGTPKMMFGEFGRVRDASPSSVLDYFLHTKEVKDAWGLVGDEIFVHRKSQTFQSRITTHRYDQIVNGLPVSGGEIAIHFYTQTLEVHGFSGQVVVNAPAPNQARAVGQAVYDSVKERHPNHEVVSVPELMYVVNNNGRVHLAHHFEILSHKVSPFFGRDTTRTPENYNVYVDAITTKLIMDIPVVHKALYRKVYTVNNTKSLPGTLLRSEGQPPVSDPVANQAYDNAAHCYYFYLNIFNRDSWNDEGAPLNSSVHYSVDYNNAFWNGEQMVYGDGDGVVFTDFAGDLSVICHELSHAVTQSTSQLRYWAESGALNEAFSDIMGSSAVVYTNDPYYDVPDPATAWIIGPNCTLINFNPDGCPDCPLGLRYMDNPVLDGQSYDYYPERYTGFSDERGVHLNSGIANLAYVLTVQGGVHPQQKTSVYVQAVSLAVAQQIYYLGFTQYLVTTSQFADARAATIQASVALKYSKAVQDSTANAWTSVGVN
jgi:Zn-dependent metalloprotease